MRGARSCFRRMTTSDCVSRRRSLNDPVAGAGNRGTPQRNIPLLVLQQAPR